MRFWDASAVVPLLVVEVSRERVERMHGDDPVLLVWWATEVECTSALARLERAGALAAGDVALARLDELSAG